MKRLFLVFVLLVSIVAIHAQDITGTWSGRLETVNGDLTVVFHINTTVDGYAGTLDSPDQNAYGIELTSVSYKDSELVIEMVNLGAEYKGKPEGKKEIKGTFSQAGQVFDLVLTKKED